MGFNVDGTQQMRNAKTGAKADLGAVVKKEPDPNYPRFDISDCGKYWFKTDEWLPCGPTGKHKHFWHCENCKVDFSFSEK